MKARDIIPGWPRGRSTTVAFPNLRYLNNYGFPPFFFTQASLTLSPPFSFVWQCHEGQKILDDCVKDRFYHAQQQKMIDDYFAKWRANFEPQTSYLVRLRPETPIPYFPELMK